MARKKRTVSQFFDDAETNGLEPLDGANVNSDKVSKGLESGTEINYDRMLHLWDEYERRNVGASPCDLRTAKHFIESIVRGCSAGQKGASMYTMLQKWTDFGAGWKRRPDNDKIPSKVSESIYFYIETELRKKFNLSTERRVRHFITVNHFITLITHLWKKDWHQYRHPRTLVQDHALYQLSIYSSARVGEYIESNMRRGSGRGLLYTNIDFVIFKNEKGQAEIGVRLTRDAKGFTNTPHKRPQHGMYEDMEPLFANPILPLLAISLADDAFQDYSSFEEIEAIPPPQDGSLHHLRIKKEMLEVPFFRTMSADGPTEKILTASSFSNRTVQLGHRAGYAENIGLHDIRAEVLVKADDNGYSKAERMKFAGHKNADTFFGSYMPQLSTVDGIASYWNLKRRTVHLEGFRGLSLHYHPQMLQSLPAKVEADLENRVDFADLNKEIAMLGEKLRGVTLEEQSQEDRARREELYWKKRQLVSEELSKWQEIQTHKVGSNEDEASPVASRPSYFNRIRRLDPSRDRLASSLFLHIPLRSPQGRIALQDMITLCKHNPPVAYRPSLRPKNGCCPVPKCAREMGRIGIASRWSHIYHCYRADLIHRHGFAELCFQCDKWFTNNLKWHEHCRSHLEEVETLPVQCNPLFFRKTLATAGQCIFCLFNSSLLPTIRFYQFLDKRSWKEHLQKHFEQHREEAYSRLIRPDENKAVTCPDPRCALSFDSTQDFQFHCQDVHCVDRINGDTAKKRRCNPRSKIDTGPDLNPSAEPKHLYAFIEEKFPSGYANEIDNTLALEPAGLVYPAGLIKPKEQSDSIRSCSPHSTSSVYSVSSKPSETYWHSQGTNLDINTPASSDVSDSLFNIDPRLRNNSISPASSTQ